MTTIDDLIEYFDAMAAKAAEIGVVDSSVDRKTAELLRELKQRRIEVSELKLKLRDWENWLAGACV
jgi:hypothetical protein